uniref:Uncharacterized protein n=1 Tax=Rhizophora mucronata TaxID=61149 RepID=A0A2P2NWN3_RHIMU
MLPTPIKEDCFLVIKGLFLSCTPPYATHDTPFVTRSVNRINVGLPCTFI